MSDTSGNRGANLGSELGRLRVRIKFSQERFAKLVGVSSVTVRNWENGVYTPSGTNLQEAIRVFRQNGAFKAGNELQEAERLWMLANLNASFDQQWFADLPPSPIAPSSATSSASRKEHTASTSPKLPSETPDVVVPEESAVDLPIQSEDAPIDPAPPDAQQEQPQQQLQQNPPDRAGESKSTPTESFAPVAQRNQNSLRLLEKVETLWIRGFLKYSLQDTPSITLQFQTQPSAVKSTWQQVLKEVEVKPFMYPVGTHIKQAYDDAGSELMILGEPGSGKTLLLLELLRVLLERAKQDAMQPMPVVFNLSSWSSQRHTLATWLVEELSLRHEVPRKVGAAWVNAGQILPLLDGLDEVLPQYRAACVAEINAFKQKQGLLPLVVCCRRADYLQQANRLQLGGAILLQPLTIEQIDTYLKASDKLFASSSKGTGAIDKPASTSSKGAGATGQPASSEDPNASSQPLASVRRVLQEDVALQELVSTPLMLSILMRAYAGQSAESLMQQSSLEERRRHMFSMYVRRMLQRRGEMPYNPQQIVRWLKWLARQLHQHGLSEFFIERLQLDWLSGNKPYRVTLSIGVGLIYALFFALVKGANYVFMQGSDQYHRSFTPLRGILDGLAIGLLNLLLFVTLNGFILGRDDARGGSGWWYMISSRLEKRLIYGLINGLCNGLLIAWLVDIPAGVYNGLFIGVIYAGLGRLDMEIQPAETLSWSWAALSNKFLLFTGGGIVLGLFYGLLTSLYWQLTLWKSTGALHKPASLPPITFDLHILLPCLLFGLILGAIIGLMISLARGLSHNKLDKKKLLHPNQGMRNSMINSVGIALLSWLLFGLFFGIIYGAALHLTFAAFGITYSEYQSYFPKISGLAAGFTNGLIVGAFFWLRSGGIPCVQHAILRFLLVREHDAPWKYAHFLDVAAERLLLRKMGGGYVFIHRLLLEYFRK